MNNGRKEDEEKEEGEEEGGEEKEGEGWKTRPPRPLTTSPHS